MGIGVRNERADADETTEIDGMTVTTSARTRPTSPAIVHRTHKALRLRITVVIRTDRQPCTQFRREPAPRTELNYG